MDWVFLPTYLFFFVQKYKTTFYPNVIYFLETSFVHVQCIIQWLDTVLISLLLKIQTIYKRESVIYRKIQHCELCVIQTQSENKIKIYYVSYAYLDWKCQHHTKWINVLMNSANIYNHSCVTIRSFVMHSQKNTFYWTQNHVFHPKKNKLIYTW